jgi:hypothetical protein
MSNRIQYMKNHVKMLMMAAAVATAQVQLANAQTYTVPGTADPWLADGGNDTYGGDPANTDLAPFQSPVFAGGVTPGGTITWSATGNTGNTPAVGSFGPNGGGETSYVATPSNPVFAALPSFSAPLSSLIGVFTGPGYADVFEMGAAGSTVVPIGATDFYLGNMDGYQWNNNSGAFTVALTGVTAPDGGMTFGLLGGALVVLRAFRRKLAC